jgi:hypothetical protein
LSVFHPRRNKKKSQTVSFGSLRGIRLFAPAFPGLSFCPPGTPAGNRSTRSACGAACRISPPRCLPRRFAPWRGTRPAGPRLLFGGLVDPGTKTPGLLLIHIFDLRERRLSVVPGSQGLWTARWSPDGRYFAALTEDSSSLMLFDFRTGKWAKLLSPGRIGDLRWSRQGKCIYLTAVPRDGEPALFRLNIASHQVERLIGMASGNVPLGLAPDDSPLVVHQIPTAEIYAFECQFP